MTSSASQHAGRRLAPLALLALSACNLTATPTNIEGYRAQTREIVPLIDAVAQPGDVILRRGHFQVLGLIPYSDLLAYLGQSLFSHAALVYERVEGHLLVLDIGPYGLQRRYLEDFLIEGPENVVVLRLVPEELDALPGVLGRARELVEADVLHDFPYGSSPDDYYCSELVDECYRAAGVPLAPLVPIRELPRLRRWYQRLFWYPVSWVLGADLAQPIAIAGRAESGIYSASVLRTVLDLVPRASGGARVREHDG